MNHYLAVDIGASSGRHIVGWMENGILHTQEVHRFPNGVSRQGDHLVWDMDALFTHVLDGIKKTFSLYPQIKSMSIDTWGVDYVLLKNEMEVHPCYAYRDSRTASSVPSVHTRIPFETLYAHTGCQFQPFNTIYQLCDDQAQGRLNGVTGMLMIASSYKQALDELERNTGKQYAKLYIVGGGAKNAFLNELTEEATGKQVIALPIEATALGNLKSRWR